MIPVTLGATSRSRIATSVKRRGSQKIEERACLHREKRKES